MNIIYNLSLYQSYIWINMREQEHVIRKLESRIKLVKKLREKKFQAKYSGIMYSGIMS